jgi:hypothetical protein
VKARRHRHLVEENAEAIVRRHLAEPGHGWSVGTYGALGEFEYDANEPGLALDLDGLSVQTPRGALTIRDIADAPVFAFVDDEGTVREFAFCTARRGAARDRVTALDDITFDVGLGAPHIDMLVRVRDGDNETAAALRAAVGMPLLAPGNPAGAAIVRSSPSRILVSAIARLDVHQPIPPAGGRSPPGPHTHLLPKFLAQDRTRPPAAPLPEGLFCGLSLYPDCHSGP